MNDGAPQLKAAATINSVSEAIDALGDDAVMMDLRPEENLRKGDADFGLWFRGHAQLKFKLVPTMLRESIGQTKRYVDEVSLTRHFKAMNPEAAPANASDFEWLVTMQHYLAPTRLLDWTENLLVALFFAVRDSACDNEDAALWILNARRLNRYTSGTKRAYEVAYAEDPDVVARSCLSRVRERVEWHDVYQRELARLRTDRTQERQQMIATAIKEVRVLGSSVNDVTAAELKLNHFNGTEGTARNPVNLYSRAVGITSEGLYARLRMPVAVYASRSNRRIRTQAGVFTLHGGKYESEPHKHKADVVSGDSIGMPIGLMEINEGLPETKPILKWLRIPAVHRAGFRETLARIGVTDATLFPELDYQSKYLLQRWTR